MAVGCFLDKGHPPTDQELRDILGSAWEGWQGLVNYIADHYQIPPELNFGGKNYGWNLWYRKSGKSLVTLYPQENRFVAQVVLGKDQVEKALVLELGENVAAVLRSTPQLHDGRWLFISACSTRDIDDIQKLLLVKRKLAKKRE